MENQIFENAVNISKQNYPLENFWQFSHYHPMFAIFIIISVFIILLFLCFILLQLVNILKIVSNRVNTFTIGKNTFTLSDKSLKFTDIESVIQQAIIQSDEERRSFESEAWNLLKSKFLKDPYENYQYATAAVAILNHALGVEMKSSRGDVYMAVMCDDKDGYYFSLYSQSGVGSLDETKRISTHFHSAAEIDLFLCKH